MGTTKNREMRTIWDYLPATLAVALGLLTNWLSNLWQPGVTVVLGGTLLAVLLLDFAANRRDRTRRVGCIYLRDPRVLPIAAGAIIVGFGLGRLGGVLPTGPLISLGRGATTMLSWAIVVVLVAVPAILSAYRRRKPAWWATYVAFSGIGLATGLTAGSDADWFLRFFLQYLAFATIAAAIVQWGSHIVTAILDMMGFSSKGERTHRASSDAAGS